MKTKTVRDQENVLEEVIMRGRALLDFQRGRIAEGNHKFAMKRRGVPDAYLVAYDAANDALKAGEEVIKKELILSVKDHVVANAFAKGHKGIGHGGVGTILATIGKPLTMFPKPSSLWHYCGGHVVDGRAPRHMPGKRSDFSPQARTILFRQATAAIKSANPYRELYDAERLKILARTRLGPSGCPFGVLHEGHEREADDEGAKRKTGESKLLQCVKPGDDGGETSAHVHAHALRVVWKRMLLDLWCAFNPLKVWKTGEPELGLNSVTAVRRRSSSKKLVAV